MDHERDARKEAQAMAQAAQEMTTQADARAAELREALQVEAEARAHADEQVKMVRWGRGD